MNQEQIRILIEALAASELSELEYSEDGCSLRLVKRGASAGAARAPETRREDGVEASPAACTQADAQGDAAAVVSADAREEVADQCLAPLYGVVHLQPSPGEPAFVRVGQRIEAGQTLCVIEAMKVFNEVRAEADATLAEVLVRSGDEVEAGQPLFRFA